MAKRPKRRAASSSRTRPAPSPAQRRGPVSAGPGPEPAETEAAQPESLLAPAEVRPSGSFLPQRQSPDSSPGAGTRAAQAAASPGLPRPAAAAAESFLPKRNRVASRAERQRQQVANLEPLDESPGVPSDRTPYLSLDLRRVLVVCSVMALLVIVGFFILH